MFFKYFRALFVQFLTVFEDLRFSPYYLPAQAGKVFFVGSEFHRSKISAADSGLHASCKAGIYGRISPGALSFSLCGSS